VKPADKGARMTQSELARHLGVSQSSISRALAGHPKHSAAFRARVKALAEREAYRPDPVLSSLNAYRRTRRPISAGSSLVWVGSTAGPTDNEYDLRLYRAAKARAEELGYGLDHLSLAEEGMTPRRVEKICGARGTPGLIIGPPPDPHTRIEIDLGPMAAVAMGRSVDWPLVDLVSTDHCQTMELCYQRLVERGYRRIAYALTSSFNEKVMALWSSIFLGQQLRHPHLEPIPPLLDDERHEPKAFLAWFRRWKPDVVITMGWRFGCLGVMKQLGIRSPRDVSVALLAVLRDKAELGDYAGIREPSDSLAALAVSILIGKIRNNERGVPAHRGVHLLPGEWIEGATVRRNRVPVQA